MAEEFGTDSFAHGYLVYQDNWTPVVGEQLLCKWEEGNPWDRYAVAIKKSGDTVGHVPCNISAVCSLLVNHCDISQSYNTLTAPYSQK